MQFVLFMLFLHILSTNGGLKSGLKDIFQSNRKLEVFLHQDIGVYKVAARFILEGNDASGKAHKYGDSVSCARAKKNIGHTFGFYSDSDGPYTLTVNCFCEETKEFIEMYKKEGIMLDADKDDQKINDRVTNLGCHLPRN